MTFYEVMMRRADRPEEYMAVVASGMDALLASIHFLDQKARAGGIRGATEVHLWDEVRVTGKVVRELLQHLEGAKSRLDKDALGRVEPIDPATEYDIYLSEV